MQPGEYTLRLTENATNTQTFTIAGIVDATGYSAAIDIRAGDTPSSTLLLGLTSSPAAGIALSASASGLAVAVTITETQTDTLTASVVTSGANWSLKVTAPGGATTQYLFGPVQMTRTPTA
jgi:hypothetical protein